MSRWVLAALLACAVHLSAQNIPPPKPPEPPPAAAPVEAPKPDADQLKRQRPKPAVGTNPKEEVPPEEDASLATEKIDFNPLQAQKDIIAGNLYFKKGNYRAAASRYKSATQYDDGNSEAWLRLAEASEKLKDSESEKEAYTRYLAVTPDARNAAEIRKKLEKMK